MTLRQTAVARNFNLKFEVRHSRLYGRILRISRLVVRLARNSAPSLSEPPQCPKQGRPMLLVPTAMRSKTPI